MTKSQRMVVMDKFTSNASKNCINFESSTTKILNPYNFYIRDSNQTYFSATER